jgi:cobalt-zinc-cadmium efflux system outer membrane protein
LMHSQRIALLTMVLAACLWLAAPVPGTADDAPAPSAPDRLSLDQALLLAARNRQELAALRADLDAASIRLQHAGLPPNPELGVEWDNLGGDLPADEVRETTVSLSQTLEIAGKASARQDKGQAEFRRLQHEQATTWLDIAVGVRTAFLQVLAAREQLALHQEAEAIASELAAITRERVAAGELPATEEIRAEARKAEAIAESRKGRRLLTEAELGLAATLAEPGLVTAGADLPREIEIPRQEALLAALAGSPYLALRRSEGQLAANTFALEKANGWSDPSIFVSVRDVPDKDGRALAFGISVPLPLFQRNQAALADAAAATRKAAINEEATVRRLQNELRKSHAVLVAADQEARTLRDEVLQRATEAAAAVREGFQAGKFRYSDVLEASRALVEVKARHLDALINLNRAAIDLDRLMGKPEQPEISATASAIQERSSR